MSAADRLGAAFPADLLDRRQDAEFEIVTLRPSALFDAARLLKSDPDLDYNFLMDLTAVDYSTYQGGRPSGAARFWLVYYFYSLRHGRALRVKSPLAEPDPEAPSLVPLYPGANWLEREVWDMFGIQFRAHPDLRRILLYEEFQGHPLRKDYPLKKQQPLVTERLRPDLPPLFKA